MVEVRAAGKTIVLIPQLDTDRSNLLNSGDEYTPAQRRIIKAGRVSKAFSDHGEFIADLHKAAAKLASRKTKRIAK